MTPKPPPHLKGAARKWWSSMIASYDGWDDPASLVLLTSAAELLQRAEAARKVIDVKGITYADRWNQPRERPECITERACLNTFRLLVRELGLDVDSDEPGRLPRLNGRYHP